MLLCIRYLFAIFISFLFFSMEVNASDAASTSAPGKEEGHGAGASRSSSVSTVSLELALPCAVNMKKGTLVIDGAEFAIWDGYFKEINALPHANIGYDLSVDEVADLSSENKIACVAMNDSCLAKPGSGVELLSLDTLIDCVGLLMFHPEVGTVAAHIAVGTNLNSLDQFLDHYDGKEDVQVTLLSSYKSNLLKRVMRTVKKKGQQVSAVYVDNIIHQENADGNIIRRIWNPADIPGLDGRVKQLSRRSQAIQLDDVQDLLLQTKVSSPVGVFMNAETGHISFLAAVRGGNAPHVSSGQIKDLRETFLKIASWSTIRYLTKVKPFETQRTGADIAFVQYPVE